MIYTKSLLPIIYVLKNNITKDILEIFKMYQIMIVYDINIGAIIDKWFSQYYAKCVTP
jgi:hypothetical protein